MKGLTAAKTYHDENTGLPYTLFKIEEGQKPPLDSKVVRVLLPVEEITSIVMHQKFKVLNSTRCAAEDSLKPVPEKCPLCRVKAPRTLRTFIPVRVRNDKDPDGVQFIEYGRNNVQEVQALLEEIPGGDITSVDFKIKRTGKKKDTKYKWYVVEGTRRPLSDDEKALEIPDIEELIELKDESELEKRAMEWQRSQGAKKTGGENDNEEVEGDESAEDGFGDDEIPF